MKSTTKYMDTAAEGDVVQKLLEKEQSSISGNESMTSHQHHLASHGNNAELKEFPSNGPTSLEKDEVITDMDSGGDLDLDIGPFSKFIERLETVIETAYAQYGGTAIKFLKIAVFFAFLGYVAYCMYLGFGDEDSFMLLGITTIVVLIVVNKVLNSRGVTISLPAACRDCMGNPGTKRIRRVMRYVLYLVATGLIATFVGVDILQHNPQNIQSVVGMFGLILICFLCSVKPSRVNWHPVFWGMVIQFTFAILTLKTQVGYDLFAWMGDSIQTFTNYSDKGSAFVLGEDFKHMGLAFSVSGVIIFFNATIFLLNHWGVIEFIVVKIGYALSVCLETGPVESVIAAANIFIGLAEAPLLVRPYLATVTKSELHAIMTCGFASIAGGIMGLFIRMGAPANHLLTAAVISAPAALAVSKLIYPEIQKVDYSKQRNIQMRESGPGRNFLSALADGAVMAITLIGAIMANMLAFFSYLGMFNSFLTWFGKRAGYDGLTFELICSYVLYPIAYLMGADPSDCGRLGALIGTKLFATPMLGYSQLGQMIENRGELEEYVQITNGTWHWEGTDVVLEAVNKTLEYGVMTERSEVIATYAMCGFSAFTAIGICLGCLMPLCPPRKAEFIELVVRAFVAGNMASFLTGAVAGVMYTG